jgi:hypothetical protein
MRTISKQSLGLKIILDETEIYPKDPGMGTPVIIEKNLNFKTYTATWNCGTETGELDGYSLTDEEKEWLESKAEQVENWMKKNGV